MNTTFLAGGRRRKLIRRKNGGPWHVRFQMNGKDILRSLGTTLEHVAASARRISFRIRRANGSVETHVIILSSHDLTPLNECV